MRVPNELVRLPFTITAELAEIADLKSFCGFCGLGG
jgi:hypothetical protein